MLQRPKALNALNLQMIRELWAAYERAGADASVRCLLLEGAGGKAFCAGGDVKGVWQEAQTDAETSSIFFREEYALNAAIAGCPKPQVSVWDGIVMGGGVGLSVHGAYRVATERTMFAMPETNIGLFPDVGGSHFLAAMPGELGTYIGLTGHRLGAADLLYSGLATHYIPSAAVTELPAALGACASAADVEAALTELGGPDAPSSSVGGGVLEQQRSLIDEAFAHDTIEAILAHLVSIQGDATRHADAVDFATATLGTLGRMSPTSMKITLRLVREARADAARRRPSRRASSASSASCAAASLSARATFSKASAPPSSTRTATRSGRPPRPRA